MPKRSRSGVVNRPRRVVAPDERELGEVDAHRARRRSFADDEVELVVFHRRIEDLLDRRAQAMDLVDEEHVAVFEIGQQRREIAGLRDDGARGGAEADAELLGHDLSQRRLAETGGPANSTWSSASPRSRAALMKTLRLARACSWPMNSASDCGRKLASVASVSRLALVTSRSVMVCS